MANVCEPFDAENAENSALAVQLYKTAGDLVRILDRIAKSATSLKDLHQPKVISYRLRLREVCERLMFVDPVRHGKKAEDFLWKKVHYDVISLAKRLYRTPNWTRNEHYWAQNHIRLGLGTYHHLIFRLQSEYICIGDESFTDFVLPITFRGSIGQSTTSSKPLVNEKVYEWALRAYQRFLICMGDLARYNQEYFDGSTIIASRYYHQALLVCSESSMPFNQLGTLVTNNNYGFDSVYYYLRCTLCNSNVFDGAKANLLRVFEKNRLWLESTSHTRGDLENKIFQVRIFLSECIKYAEFVYKYPIEDTNDSIGILCENVITDFQRCLELEAVPRQTPNTCCNTDAPCHLSSDVIFKMFITAIMCIDKFEKQDSSNKLASTAFLLASFSNLLNHILFCIQEFGYSVEGGEKQNDDLSMSSPIDEKKMDDITNLNLSQELNRKDPKMRKKKKPKAVRHRKKIGFDDSDLSEGCDTTEDDGSENEMENEDSESSDTSIENEDDNDDEDEKESNQSRSNSSNSKETLEERDTVLYNSISDLKTNFALESKVACRNMISKPVSSFQILQSIDPLVVVVRVCCNWLENHPHIILASAQGSKKLWSRFVIFVNLLVDFVSKLDLESCDSKIALKSKEWDRDNWNQEYLLPEDLTLNGLDIFPKDKSDRIIKDTRVSSRLAEIDQMVLRIASIRHFTYDLTKNYDLGIEYYNKNNEFVYNRSGGQTNVEATINEAKEENREQKQNLMQNMAQLWLEAEVKELESSVQLLDRPRFSPYLIPDISVLLTHLDLIAQLMASKIFIFILPIIALQHLDEKKKESSNARKAIRWLEAEFQKHNRYLRAQKSHERITLPLLKYPKRRDKEAWNVFSVLECAKYFSRYGNNAKSSSACLATILVTSSKMSKSTEDESKSKVNGFGSANLVPLARSSDLKVENVVDFYNKWKSSTNKSTSVKLQTNPIT